TEQIAGDELDDASFESVIATGFHRLGAWDDEPADFAVDRYDQLDDIVNTTSQTFLALTMGCARCHDHKFDPLLQTDYYSIVAIFNPLQRPQSGRSELSKYAASPPEALQLQNRDAMIADINAKVESLRERLAVDFLKTDQSSLSAETKEAFLTAPDQQSVEQKKLVRDNHTKLLEESRAIYTDEHRQQIAEGQSAVRELKE
ncbi:MAG: DUF1549 domain-containing protein, partial [Fuerstiella sp.]|nr:DUF1549 domain-containing protein [Fuerstiella sp.]